MNRYPSEFKYSKNNEWVKKEDGVYSVGITDYAQKEIGDISYIKLPKVGDIIKKDASLCELESAKSVSDVKMPLNGKVFAINKHLLDNPEDINKDPYGLWIVKIEIFDENDYENLLTSTEKIV